MKLKDVLTIGTEKLKEYNVDDASIKAKILLEYILNFLPKDLTVNYENEISDDKIQFFFKTIDEIVDGKPIQYITNNQEFYGLNFFVDETVLIPQPDTEILVEEVINICKKKNKKAKILDMCTGSGAIAISISKNIDVEITATDISHSALKIAEKNAQKNNVNAKFIESDMFDQIGEKFDIIVSNPPYIESNTIKNLSKEVQNEPILALDGGTDGLKFYKILAENAKKYLNEDGILAVEIGYNQRNDVEKLFEINGFEDIYCKKDYSGNERIIVGKINSNK